MDSPCSCGHFEMRLTPVGLFIRSYEHLKNNISFWHNFCPKANCITKSAFSAFFRLFPPFFAFPPFSPNLTLRLSSSTLDQFLSITIFNSRYIEEKKLFQTSWWSFYISNLLPIMSNSMQICRSPHEIKWFQSAFTYF